MKDKNFITYVVVFGIGVVGLATLFFHGQKTPQNEWKEYPINSINTQKILEEAESSNIAKKTQKKIKKKTKKKAKTLKKTKKSKENPEPQNRMRERAYNYGTQQGFSMFPD